MTSRLSRDELIEQMARALFNKFSAKPETWNWDCERMLEPWRDDWRSAVSAALSVVEKHIPVQQLLSGECVSLLKEVADLGLAEQIKRNLGLRS